MGKNNAYLPNIEPLLALGINPVNGLPVKFGSFKCNLKEDVKKALRIVDEQDACNRYKWEGIEQLKMTSQELERMLYYRGQLCLFKIKELDQLCILPYALNGTIDLYGRFNHVKPIPFSNGSTDDEKKAKTPLAEYLSLMKLKVIYGKEEEVDDPDNSCVLLHDYTKQLSQTIIPRVTVNEPLLDTMSECVPFMRTKLILSTGVKGIRVADADQQESVADGSRRLEKAALQGEAYVPIVGNIEFQELADKSAGTSEECMVAMQSLDNLRLSTYGIENGGLFNKKAHMLNSEQEVNSSTTGLVLQDGLGIRQNFCDIANKVFGLNISVSVNQATKPMEEEPQEGEQDNETTNDDSTI